MINIKELSIGNWIKISGTPVQILGIRTESQVYVLETEETDYAYAIDADIEPIEITPEILEKNGFEKREFIDEVNCKEEYWIYCDDYYSLVISEINDGLYKVEHHSEELINLIERLYISYIHQLQNALTLCGISKEIKL